MLFNSIEFAFFLPVVFAIYWLIGSRRLKAQNLFLLGSSYVFYGWWDWRFLLLIAFSSIVDFFIGNLIASSRSKARRKSLLILSLVANLGVLATFKYFNFFIDSLEGALLFFGNSLDISRLSLILPVGISFYTFQTLSYTIDIYKEKLEPSKSIIDFFAFVSFFPQLVAGPIERASNLLPQFQTKRVFSRILSTEGLRQILWGLFKKMVVADNCANLINPIFENYAQLGSIELLIGVILFSFQIYCDFSGYSDIAIGTSKLFGFNLMTNFKYPYFSKNLVEFWRTWHISLSTWFRDYVYLSLGGSRVTTCVLIRNIAAVFIISGLWHGANWTFILWGAIHATAFILFMQIQKLNIPFLARIPVFFQVIFTFTVVSVAWVFFRASSVSAALLILGKISSLVMSPFIYLKAKSVLILMFILILLIIEWLNRHTDVALNFNRWKTNKLIRWTVYVSLVYCIILFGGESQEFIYFQF